MSESVLLEKFNSLPEDAKSEVFDFVDFLVEKNSKNQIARKTPKAGCGKDLIAYVAPDFDAPLEEFKEYME